MNCLCPYFETNGSRVQDISYLETAMLGIISSCLLWDKEETRDIVAVSEVDGYVLNKTSGPF